MKSVHALALLALSTPAFAQTPQAPAAPETSAVVTNTIAVTPATPAPAAPPELSDLSIPIPANADLKMEIDATDDNMLGQVKDALAGINAQDMLDSMVVGEDTDRNDPDKPHLVAKKHKFPPALTGDAAKISLADILHNIKHVHMVVLNLRPVPVAHPNVHAKAVPTPSPDGLAPLRDGETSETPVVAAQKGHKIVSYYETSFHSAGGRRVVWLNQEPVCVMVESFGKNGTAMVLQMPEAVTILRTDGNLDLKPINALFSAAMHEAAEWVRLQD